MHLFNHLVHWGSTTISFTIQPGLATYFMSTEVQSASKEATVEVK